MEASVIFPTAIFLLFQSSNCNLSVTAILTYNGCIGKQEKKGRSDKIHNVRRHLIGSYYGNLCVDTLVATDAINSAHLLQKLCWSAVSIMDKFVTVNSNELTFVLRSSKPEPCSSILSETFIWSCAAIERKHLSRDWWTRAPTEKCSRRCAIQYHIGTLAIAKPCVHNSCTEWDNTKVE